MDAKCKGVPNWVHSPTRYTPQTVSVQHTGVCTLPSLQWLPWNVPEAAIYTPAGGAFVARAGVHVAVCIIKPAWNKALATNRLIPAFSETAPHSPRRYRVTLYSRHPRTYAGDPSPLWRHRAGSIATVDSLCAPRQQAIPSDPWPVNSRH